jgi:hypothetical protein
MQHEKTWTIFEIREGGEKHEVASGVSQFDALVAIRAAMYGEADSLIAPSQEAVHDLALAA